MNLDTAGARSPLTDASSPQGSPTNGPRHESDITSLLHDWSDGDPRALDRLVPLVDRDLRRLAQSHLARESPGHTLQATAVVNELYLLLLDQKRICWQNRGQFLAIAATLMRRILVNHARKKQAAKRGGQAVVLALDEALGIPEDKRPELVALDHALDALARFAPRQSRIVELRFFGGLTIEETASVLGISPATVRLDWTLAKAWLFRELNRD